MTHTKTVKRAYKNRFYPTPEQEALLRQTFGCVRLVYNKVLEARTTAWKTNNESLKFKDAMKLSTEIINDPELPFLKDVSCVPLQQSVRHLWDGLSAFFDKRSKYPKFKSRKKSRSSATFTRSAFRYDPETQTLRLAKTTEPLNMVWHNPLPEDVIPSSITVSMDRAGRWFVSALCETTVTELPVTTKTVGIDLGVTHIAVMSDGTKIEAPRYGRADHGRIKKAQQNLSRKQKGSKNREKARVKLARAHGRVADRRRDFLHKTTTDIIRENQTIVIEDLNVQGMTRKGKRACKRGLNRSILDAGFGEFRSMLEYKADWYGRTVIVIDRWFPSSQICSTCQRRDGKKPLDVRTWTCPKCHTVHDRDVNASINIEAAGLAVTACGGDGSAS